jgi:hypothetical protein
MKRIGVSRQSVALTAALVGCLGPASAAIHGQGNDNAHHGNPIEFKNIYVRELR